MTFEIVDLAAASSRTRIAEPMLLVPPESPLRGAAGGWGGALGGIFAAGPLAADPPVATVDAYGAPSYGPHKGKLGMIVYHTPENVDHTLAQAVAIARWQASAGNTSGGSYHGILGWDSARGPMTDPDAWVMVRSVPWNQIAGGLSTRRDAVWAPGRYSWIKGTLSPAAYADPNAYAHQISVSGRAAWWASKMSTAAGRASVAGALIALARWVVILERAYAYNALLTLHRHWQTNRTDPDGLNFGKLVLDEWQKIVAPAPEPAPPPPPPDPRLAAKDARFDAAGVRVRELEATIAAGIEAIRHELRTGRNT